ncbi:unnamed protein product [Lepidochelys olivacea]
MAEPPPPPAAASGAALAGSARARANAALLGLLLPRPLGSLGLGEWPGEWAGTCSETRALCCPQRAETSQGRAAKRHRAGINPFLPPPPAAPAGQCHLTARALTPGTRVQQPRESLGECVGQSNQGSLHPRVPVCNGEEKSPAGVRSESK